MLSQHHCVPFNTEAELSLVLICRLLPLQGGAYDAVACVTGKRQSMHLAGLQTLPGSASKHARVIAAPNWNGSVSA